MTEEDTTCPTCGEDKFETVGGMRNHHATIHNESLIEDKEGEFDCPSCERSDFDSELGLKQHHAKTHNESLVKEWLVCENCGDDFEAHICDNRKYCGWDCRADHMVGENAPSYGVKHSEEVRQRMSEAQKGIKPDDETIKKMSESQKGRVISEEEKRKISESKSGKNCHLYGVTGEDHPRGGKENSEKHNKAISEANSGKDSYWYGVTGEDHPLWKEDYVDSYSVLYRRENREKAIRRDDEECRVCEMDREEHNEEFGWDIEVHHINSRESFMTEDMIRPPDKAAELNNLFTVCRHCHGPVESGEIDIPDNGNKFVDNK